MEISHKINNSEWDDMIKNCEYSTFFHTKNWINIFASTYEEMSDNSIKITFKDKKVLILPLLKNNKTKLFINNPAGTYGGWISKDNLSKEQKIQALGWIKKNLNNLVLRANPLDKDIASFYKTYLTNAERKDSTQIIRLNHNFDQIQNQFSKGHKYNIKKSKEHNLAITKADSLKDYEEYYNVYKDSIKRWGELVSSTYPFALFKNIHNSHNKNIKLWLVKHKGEVISGALVFYCNKHVVWWHGASLEKYFKLYASNYLQSKIIEHACVNGFLFYDFNPSGGHPGVQKFKSSFGPENFSCNIYHYKKTNLINFITHKYNNVKEKSKKIIRKMSDKQT